MSRRSFIETQFPLARLSLESYKERKANLGQTLTGLGKWWGRKPLVLVRASILGLLMPASDNPSKDREVFYKILTMDEDGLWRRKNKKLSAAEVAGLLSAAETSGLINRPEEKASWVRGSRPGERERLERIAFARLSYEEKLAKCCRPEEVDGPGPEAWSEINSHLGTNARDLNDLFLQLSERSFGHRARVGDCFCGGGSVPFEAARLGLEAFGSDLNPVAALLTWGAVHLTGGRPEVTEKVRAAQEKVWKRVDEQISAWGIEHDSSGNRADAFLYCVEAKCPATGLWVPLAPSWIIGERTKTVAILKRNDRRNGYDIEIMQGATQAQMIAAKRGTVQDGKLVDPEDTNRKYSIASLRGDQRGESYGLRLWENEDLVPRPDDVFQERLYCVRWVAASGERAYKSVTEEDLARERKVVDLLTEHFGQWQREGYIPSKKISEGAETSRLYRERGWTYWHHLFNPRQLLLLGTVFREFQSIMDQGFSKAFLCGMGRIANWNSKLCRWHPHQANEKGEDTFSNQALNTLYNYSVRPLLALESAWHIIGPGACEGTYVRSTTTLLPVDARDVSYTADLWITDPPYADAVNYHELADFFLAWYEKQLPKVFPDWYTDSRAALAVRGSDEDFRKSMVDIYANLARHMPDQGLQLVMFTHQDSGVWADLGMILWAAGLRVTAAWTIGTETTSSLKEGNYVQGTVLLVLRKRLSDRTAWLDELYPKVDDEVRSQINLMQSIDDVNSPQFGDTDYQLGAYAAALRVLTGYSKIEGMDIRHELFRTRSRNEKSEFQKVIDRAVIIATNFRVPRGIESHVWRNLDAMERLYLAGLELERHGEARQGAYQELARGFGVPDYGQLLADEQANHARFKIPSEFRRTGLSGTGFAESLLRHILFAVHETARAETPREGLSYLKAERADYWARKEDIFALLEYLAAAITLSVLPHWKKDAEAALVLAGAVRNDYVGSR